MRFILPNERIAIKIIIDKLIQKSSINPITVEVKEHRPLRTLKQNRYLHLIIGWFGIETGYTMAESKQVFKEYNAHWFAYEKNGKRFWKSTAQLNSKELTECIDRFRDYSNENGVYLAAPYETAMLQYYDNQIENNKRWMS